MTAAPDPDVCRLLARALHVLNADPQTRARAVENLASAPPEKVSDLPSWLQRLIGDAARGTPAGAEVKRKPWDPAKHPRDARGRFTRFTPVGKGVPTKDELARVSDASLGHMVGDPAVAADGQRLTLILEELDRRDRADQQRRKDEEFDAATAKSEAEQLAAAAAEYRKLRSGVEDYIEEAGEDPADILPPDRKGIMPIQEVRKDWEIWVNQQALAAEDATRGNLLSAVGKRRGASVYDLFTGRADNAVRWASEELINWWEEDNRRRMSFPEWYDAATGSKSTSARRSREHWLGSLKRWQDGGRGRGTTRARRAA